MDKAADGTGHFPEITAKMKDNKHLGKFIPLHLIKANDYIVPFWKRVYGRFDAEKVL